MKRPRMAYLRLSIIFSVFLIALCANGKRVEAFSWNTTLGNSPKVVKVGDDIPDYDSTALNLKLMDGDNELQIYDKNGSLTSMYSMYENKNYIWLKKGDTIKITKAGIKDGKYVDLVLKNESNTEGTNGIDTPYIYLSGKGEVAFYKQNLVALDSYAKFLNMKVIDHDTSAELPNQKFYLSFYVPSIGYSYGRFVEGYDKNLTYNYLIPSTDTFLNNNTVLDSITSSTFDYMTVQGSNAKGQGNFSVYGSTGASGYSLGLYSGSAVSAASAIFFFDPSVVSIVPNEYPGLKIDDTATPNEDSTKATLTMTQDLPMQRTNSYIPANDSFKLSVSEKNTDFLDIKNDDFQLSVDGAQVPSSAYKLITTKNGTATTIDITFTSDYLKSLNTAPTGSKSVVIKQTSSISNDQGKITAAIKDYSFTIPTSSTLSYTFSNGSSKNVQTPEKNVSLKLTPALNGDSVKNATVLKGTKVGDIAQKDVITNVRNEKYSWDTVTAAYTDPTSILNTVGSALVPFTLTSQTFGNTSQVNTSVNVKDTFSLTYDANGAQGTPPSATVFNAAGISLATQGNLTKTGYSFEGWSASKDGSSKIYQPGDLYGAVPEEAKDTTLYAIWKKQFYDLTTSWSATDAVQDTMQEVDRSEKTVNMAYYWKTTGKAKYKINVVLNSKVLSTSEIENTVDNQAITKESINIPIDQINNYGDNALEIQFFQLDADGKEMSQDPNDKLNVTIQITGSLQLKSVPERLNWTGRTIDKTKGIIDRDSGNDMSLEVLDSRNIDDSNKNWRLQASLTNEKSAPFTFVWKQTQNSSTVPLKDSSVEVMNSSTVAKNSEYIYASNWKNDEGILLSSDSYLSIGDYSDKVTVNWNLYDTKNAE